MIEHDVGRDGPLLDWALAALRDRLPELLGRAGADTLAAAVEPERIAGALERVRSESERMLAAGRPVRVEPLPAAGPASPS